MPIQRILHLIDLAGINAKTLTLETGLSHSAVTEWKKGKAKPSVDAFVKIAEYFKVPIEYLLGMGVFSNWHELQSNDALDAIVVAVQNDYPRGFLITGDSILAFFCRVIYDNEMERIRFFDWAVKSVRIEEAAEVNDEYFERQKYLTAHIEYSDIFKMMVSQEERPFMKAMTMKEVYDDFIEEMKLGPYGRLDEDEKQLLDQYRILSGTQKGEVFKLINSLQYKPFG